MKYGKQYLESLESVPEEWRKQAIEYRKLKKVINRVASELKDLGLTSEVLKELLENHQRASNSPPSSSSALPATHATPPTAQANGHVRWSDSEDDGKNAGSEARIEEVIDEAEGVVLEGEEGEGMSEKKKGKQSAEGKGVRKRRVRATYELAGTTAAPEPRIHLVFSSCSSESYSSSGDSSSHPSSSSAHSDEEDDAAWDSDELAASPAKFLFSARNPRPPRQRKRPSRRLTSDSVAEAAAERLADLSDSPAVSGPSSTSATSPPSASNDSGEVDADASDAPASESGEPALPSGEAIEFEGAGPHAKGLLRRMYGVGAPSTDSGGSEAEGSAVEVRLKDSTPEEESVEEEDGGVAVQDAASEEGLKRVDSIATLRPSFLRSLSAGTVGSSAAAVPSVDDLDVQSLSLAQLEKMKVGESEGEKRRSRELKEKKSRKSLRREEEAEEGDDEGELRRGLRGSPKSSSLSLAAPTSRPRRRRHRPRQHRREVFIPLTSDSEFLTLLTSALNSLATLQLAQKRQFTESVRILAEEVSDVSSPSRPKTDLYIWREIFALWVEAAIFESSRERDRGERAVEEVEKKLEWFVDQVAKRKLAKKMRNKESRGALEKFIALNVELLDLKKFQIANEEAARKILKKHDKRTALTASYGFPKFLGSSDSSSSDSSDPLALISSQLIPPSEEGGLQRSVLTLPGFPSLPHILLSTFTTTLLPIIPALEDYECSICGDVAFKPIRLSCGHKFCVRCLVKMQKRGQDSCPQCRSTVVLRANASNLDHEMQQFLIKWFPKEVKLKEKSNRVEAGREELEEMGIVDRKCVVM